MPYYRVLFHALGNPTRQERDMGTKKKPTPVTTKLSAKSYSLGDRGGERHPNIPDTAKDQLIAATESRAHAMQAAATRRIIAKDLLDYVRDLATEAGIVSSDDILLKQIIRPALRKRR